MQDYLAPLIGWKTAGAMGLIVVDYNLVACVSETRTLGSMNCIFYNYPDVFGESLGSLPGKVHLVTKQSACAKAVTNF